MTQKILITSALPYANGPIHFGHIAGAYLPGDCYARYQRLRGADVKYFCGSDEYGVAITMSAEIAGRSPQEHVDIFHAINKSIFEKLSISFDHYSRTTWEGHPTPVIEFFQDLLANGYIEEKISDHLYSEADDTFLADRYVVGTCPSCGYDNARGDECSLCGMAYDAVELLNPKSKLTGSPLLLKPTKHWFLRLDAFTDKLVSWIETKNWKSNVINFVKKYIEEIRPRAITRDSHWGIPVPLENADGKVVYVWFDAPIGYISAAMEWAQQQGDPDLWKNYWLDPETKLVHFIGKDNIPFHAVIFPAMIMGQNTPYKLVDELPANEFYNLEGRQFSKSEGWYIDLDEFLQNYSVEQIRYAIAANAPETSDSEFTWKDFQMRCNAELLGKLGNFVNRTLVFAQKYCNAAIPNRSQLEEVDSGFLATIDTLVDTASLHFDEFSLRKACQTIMELAQHGNSYFDAKKPWSDVKDPSTQARAETTISCCISCVQALATISAPIIPSTSARIWKLLGYKTPLTSWERDELPIGHTLPPPTILFSKIEDAQIEKEIEKLHTMLREKKVAKTLKELIPFEHFQKLDLRIGSILEAAPIPKSNKLLQIKVDIGSDVHTVVAGIRKHYNTADLIGKKVVIVANLMPATIRGVQSQGMLLAASSNNTLELLTISSLPVGSVVS